MMRYVVSPEAAADLHDIFSHYSFESEQAAETLHLALLDAFDMLAGHPRVGTLRMDLTPTPIRTWTVYSHMIFYDPETRPIGILRVLHGARDLPRAFGTKAPSPPKRRRKR
jgi:plasmid stabilization system protein ParE